MLEDTGNAKKLNVHVALEKKSFNHQKMSRRKWLSLICRQES